MLGICLATVQCQLDWFDMVMSGNRVTEDTEAVPDPPPHELYAKMAKYVVHYSYWGSLTHISWHQDTFGYPMSRAYSLSDGPIGQSTGVPYFYITLRDDEMQDIAKDSRVSLTLSLDQGDFCKRKTWITEDPRCPQVRLTGNFVFLPNITVESRVAERALYSRFPVMQKWPKTHGFMFAKIKIQRILLVDWVGGNKYPSVQDYFAANLTSNVYQKENNLYDSLF